MIGAAQEASLADQLADLPAAERAALLAPFTGGQLEQLEHDWRLWARPGQMAPAGDWLCWLVLAGRGFGKTRMGAEWVRQKACDPQARIALVGGYMVGGTRRHGGGSIGPSSHIAPRRTARV